MPVVKPQGAEPGHLKWIDPATGYPCMIQRVHPVGTPLSGLVGHVRVPRGHKLHRLAHIDRRVEGRVDVHGGLTFSGRPERHTGGSLRGHWFGFYCPARYAESMSVPPASGSGGEGTWAYVKRQVEAMARQLKGMA